MNTDAFAEEFGEIVEIDMKLEDTTEDQDKRKNIESLLTPVRPMRPFVSPPSPPLLELDEKNIFEEEDDEAKIPLSEIPELPPAEFMSPWSPEVLKKAGIGLKFFGSLISDTCTCGKLLTEEERTSPGRMRRVLKRYVDAHLEKLTAEQLSFYQRHVRRTMEQIRRIANMVQRSLGWKINRIGRMTASAFASYLNHNSYKTPKGQLDEVTTENVNEDNEAMKWGRDHEDEARNDYISQERPKVAAFVREARAKNQSTFRYANRDFPVHLPAESKAPDTPESWFFVTELGLLLDEDHQHLACSADGLIWVMGRLVGILEIKCPYKKQLYPVIPIYYYDQLMANCKRFNLAYCDFFVWIPNATSLSRFEYDPNYSCLIMDLYLHEYYFTEFLPTATLREETILKLIKESLKAPEPQGLIQTKLVDLADKIKGTKRKSRIVEADEVDLKQDELHDPTFVPGMSLKETSKRAKTTVAPPKSSLLNYFATSSCSSSSSSSLPKNTKLKTSTKFKAKLNMKHVMPPTKKSSISSSSSSSSSTEVAPFRFFQVVV
jgi:hypothetical protein